MQSFVEKARVYMIALMKAGDYTVEDVAAMTESSVNTIKNFLSKKTSKNPGFDSITNWILGLGGDLNELVGYEKKKEIEVNSQLSLKETYEVRISDIASFYNTRIEDIKALCEMRISDVQKSCEIRIADLKQNYEERLKEQRELLSNHQNNGN